MVRICGIRPLVLVAENYPSQPLVREGWDGSDPGME
jgi:hypothetical protein